MFITIEQSYKIKELLDEAKNILIAVHEQPDGDAIGSGLAMLNALKKEGYNVDFILKKAGKCFSFLKGFDIVKSDESELINRYDTLIVLDCADKSRIDLKIDFSNFKNIISIDHHVTHIEFATITLLNYTAPATCQIVYDLINNLNWKIDITIAECIYTGILTDTGGLKYSNVEPHTFEIARNLLQEGIDINMITRKVFEVMSYGKFGLTKLALNNIEIIDKKIAYLYLTKSQIDMYNDNKEADIHEGLVNYGRNIENVEVSIFIRENDKGKYKISLRSNDYVDVSKIAQNLGGGGHIRASGASVEGDIEQIKDSLINEIKKMLM